MIRDSISVQFMSGPQDGLQITLKLERGGDNAWIIGRSDDCDIPLKDDPQASRVHARLVCKSSDETMADGAEALRQPLLVLRLVDLESRNGTHIHDRRLRNEGLDFVPGDLFRVGRTWLRVDP
ncbi:MAG: FHA domain-containing protein [Anaerolineae bacterium]|nr:FHA domain-containing protein [Anaerolineae bacterium]